MFQVELSLKEPSPFFLINLFLSSLASWLKCYPSRNHKQNLRISTVLLYYSFLPHITIAIKCIQVTCIIDFIYYIKITTYMSILYVHTNYTHTHTDLLLGRLLAFDYLVHSFICPRSYVRKKLPVFH